MAKPANQNSATEWINLPEGMWRFVIGAPVIKIKESKWGVYPELTFALTLTEKEQERLVQGHGEPPEGKQQSYRLWVRGKEATACGYYKSGQYQQTDCGLAQLMCAAIGSKASRQLREWMATGGVPPLTPDQTQQAEWEELISWYSWFENLEVYATVRHDPSTSTPGQMYAHVAAILPVGSLPGQPETVYQQMCAGKVRTMLGVAGVPAKDVDPEPESITRPGETLSDLQVDQLGNDVPAAATVEATAPVVEMSEEAKARLAAEYALIFGPQGVPA